MTFIVHFKDSHREQYSNHYNEDVEHERDAAWDDVYAAFPDADYIEEFFFNMTLDEYLLIRFNKSNHPKYRKYAIEWINNLTTEQLSYFKKEMIKSIIV